MKKYEEKGESVKKIEKKDNNKISRRKFFKVSAAAGTAGAAIGISVFPERAEEYSKDINKILPVKERENFPVLITNECKRMDHKNTAFIRQMWDFQFKKELTQVRETKDDHIKKSPPGWTQLDQALDQAAWAVDGAIAGMSAFGVPQSQAYQWDGDISRNRYFFKNKEDAAKKIKKAASFLGADLIGVTKHDPLWDYSRLVKPKRNDRSENSEEKENQKSKDGSESSERSRQDPKFDDMFESVKPNFPFKPKSVIVLAFEMDYAAIAASPSAIEGAATGFGYSRMAATGYSVASFIRSLGYKAFACGNDVSLSVPYAIAAGLGELGRNGMLITREFGPRVRIAKIYTELEIKINKPKTFGVWEFCKSCKRCADSCPSNAIPQEAPTLKGKTISNNSGVLKWYINPEKCYKFWGENQSDCTNCITACPFNKPSMWHHKLMSEFTAIPGASLHYIMAKMDKVFGFGNVNDKKANKDFWEKEE